MLFGKRQKFQNDKENKDAGMVFAIIIKKDDK